MKTKFDRDRRYCTVDDVAKLFRKEGAFGSNTNPSKSDVEDMIDERTDFIDRETRNSWRENKVINEMHTFDGQYRWSAGRPLMLNKMKIITPLDSSKGDRLEIWDGNEWHDWVADSSEVEGRDGDYWLDGEMGQLFIYKRFTWVSQPQIRVSYRYGSDASDTDGDNVPDDLPRDIRMACAKLVAIDLVSSDQHTQLVPGGEGAPSPESAMEQWRKDVFGDQNQTGVIDRHKIDPAWVEPY